MTGHPRQRLVQLARSMATHTAAKRKVAILGAAGGIGQPLSLLMKMEATSVSHLSLYDIANMGMAVDLSHIPTCVSVTGHQGSAELGAALEGAEVVLIPAGVPRKPGMTRDDLFNTNAGIVKTLVEACAQHCPNAHLLVISNPVNSTVPIAWEVMRAAGVAQPSIFGVTQLDLIRAQTFVGDAIKSADPHSLKVPVLGGHSGPTMVPVLSGYPNITGELRSSIINRIQYGGDEVVKAKAGTGSATLSMAWAAADFYRRFVAALDGKAQQALTAFIRNPAGSNNPLQSLFQQAGGYFACEMDLTPLGHPMPRPLPSLDAGEQELLQAGLVQLRQDVAKGEAFVTQSKAEVAK